MSKPNSSASTHQCLNKTNPLLGIEIEIELYVEISVFSEDKSPDQVSRMGVVADREPKLG